MYGIKGLPPPRSALNTGDVFFRVGVCLVPGLAASATVSSLPSLSLLLRLAAAPFLLSPSLVLESVLLSLPRSSSSLAALCNALRSGHDCAVTIADRSASLFTFANLPLIRGRLSAKVLRHSYLIFLCPRCLAMRLARYLCSCACLSADCAKGRVSTVSSRNPCIWYPPF